MLLRDTRSNAQPSAVLVDTREDGTKSVRMAGNVREENEDGQVIYVYDEVVFDLEAGRTETAEDITEAFYAWWDFGSQPEEPLPTLEERVAAIEDYIISGGEI